MNNMLVGQSTIAHPSKMRSLLGIEMTLIVEQNLKWGWYNDPLRGKKAVNYSKLQQGACPNMNEDKTPRSLSLR